MGKIGLNKFKKNNLLNLFLIFITVFFVFGIASASANTREKVNISYYNDSAFYKTNESMKLEGGYAYDLIASLNRYLNWDINYVYGDFKKSLNNVKTGETDLIFGVLKTAEREKDYVFNEEPIDRVDYYICGRADEEYLNDDYSKLSGKRFGFIKGTNSYKKLKDFLQKSGVKGSFIMANTYSELNKMFINNKIDYFVINSNLITKNEKILQKIFTQPIYIMATKDKKELVEKFDIAIRKLRTENFDLMKKLLTRINGQNDLNLSRVIDVDKQGFVRTAKEIRCGVIENKVPYYFKDDKGNVKGLVKIVTDKIQKSSGLKFTLIPFANANEEIKALKENKIDAIGMLFDNSSNVQKYNLNLSQPYMSSQAVILTSKAKKITKNIKNLYAIKRNPYGQEAELKIVLPNARFKNYGTIQECVDALNKGEVGAAIVANFNAKVNNGELKNVDNLVSYYADGISFKHCIGFSNRLDVRYLELTDKIIENLDSNEIKMSVISTVNNHFVKTPFELFFNEYKMPIMMIFVLIIIMLCVLYLQFLRFERTKLALGDKRFKKASQQAQVSYWEYSYDDKKITFFDEHWPKRHGFKKNIIENYDIEKRKDYLDKETRTKIFKTAMAMQQEDEKELRINAKGIDGKMYYYLIKVSAIRDDSKKLVKALGSILDVTNARNILDRYEQEVKRNEVMGSMLVASFMVNLSKDKITANSDCLIAKKDELIGMNYSDFFQKYLEISENEKQSKFLKTIYLREQLIDSFSKGHRDFSVVARINNHGKLSWVEIAIHQTKDPFSNDIIGIIYVRDAKERETLQSALDLAEAANDAKSNFLSSVSHEIRTPMNAIMGLTDMAIEKAKKIKDKSIGIDKDLSNIKLSSEYLLAIINDILEMSRIESGKTQLNKAVFDSYAFVKMVTTIISMQAQEKGIEFKYIPDKNLKRYYIGDEVKLKKVFINILGNAIKFTPKNGKVTCTSKIISCNNKRTIVKAIIEDTGIGISNDFLKHIFEPFSREGINESLYQGTGLGMAISKNFINMMDGDIKIESKIGKGTVVRITFAVENYDESKLDRSEGNEDVLEIEKAKVKQYFKGLKILLVEDNKLNALIAKHLLAKMGFEIETAINGKIAIDMFSEKPKDYYFAILMDIRMPIMGGLEATKCIRKLKREDAKTIPIVAMTANAFDIDRINSLEAGMNEHLTKPIDLDKLLKSLSKFIKR